MSCSHSTLIYDTSPSASSVGYQHRSDAQLRTAAGQSKNAALPIVPKSTYPPPLVLPGDELSWDPKYPAQSLRQWSTLKMRNPIESRPGGRNVLYVVRPPKVQKQLAASMSEWRRPKLSDQSGDKQMRIQHPKVEDVVSYLAAFYHGVSVQLLPDQGDTELTFAPWEEAESRPKKRSRTSARSASRVSASRVPDAIALQTSKEAIKIRVRQRKDDIYKVQLNLNDLLDVASEILPEDAYAILMLIEQDMYEDDEDDFACGRAYGGSRISVVSMARYHPGADEKQGVDLEHAWPASHCKSFVETMTAELPQRSKSTKKAPSKSKGQGTSKDDPILLSSPKVGNKTETISPMKAAVTAYANSMTKNLDNLQVFCNTSLWLGRVCRTTSHELGHCFGIDHCVFFACSMQGTASIQEDARQPPYLCPVDLAKLQGATGVDEIGRYEALERVCSGFERENDLFFSSFAAWLRACLRELHAET